MLILLGNPVTDLSPLDRLDNVNITI